MNMEKKFIKNNILTQPPMPSLSGLLQQIPTPPTANYSFELPKFKTNFNIPFGKKSVKKGNSCCPAGGTATVPTPFYCHLVLFSRELRDF